jgi:hypothetical protein
MTKFDHSVSLKFIAPIGLIALFVYLGSFTLKEPRTRQATTNSYLLARKQSPGPVEENMEKRLRAEPELSEAHITAVLVSKDAMAIRGTLINFHQKQLALQIAREQNAGLGGFKVVDELQVVPTVQFSIPGEMLIADTDGMLHPREYQPPANLMSGTRLNELHRRHLQDVVNASKELFPKGTKIQSVRGRGASPIEVNFNKAFTNPRFWRRHKTIKLAVYSIVDNIGNMGLPKGPPLPVQILVEGKRVDEINGFDISKPRKPDMSIVVRK